MVRVFTYHSSKGIRLTMRNRVNSFPDCTVPDNNRKSRLSPTMVPEMSHWLVQVSLHSLTRPRLNQQWIPGFLHPGGFEVLKGFFSLELLHIQCLVLFFYQVFPLEPLKWNQVTVTCYFIGSHTKQVRVVHMKTEFWNFLCDSLGCLSVTQLNWRHKKKVNPLKCGVIC